MSGRGLRIGIVGATGALGVEVLAALDASGLRIAEILPLATQRSLGEELEFQGALHPVRSDAPELRGLDLLFCCAPPLASLPWVRTALRSEVACIDCSGAFSDQPDVPLCVAALPAAPGGEGSPLLATPSGAALAWSLALAPIQRAAGIQRVTGNVLESAAAGGRDAISALSLESLALFNQQALPEEAQAMRPLAFDCHPAMEPPDEQGRTASERRLEAELRRVLRSDFSVAASILQIPAFVGQASSLLVETTRPLDPKEAEDHLAHAAGVELWLEAEGPNLRAASGRDVVIVGRVRRDHTRTNGLLLWLVADVLRLSAVNAVALAQARLQTH